jgi:hypothetical protein
MVGLVVKEGSWEKQDLKNIMVYQDKGASGVGHVFEGV